MTGKEMTEAMKIVIMGVAGCGKSSIGVLLAKAMHVPFKDGDDLHPEINVQKMASGIALIDEDRWPWLDLCGLTLQMPKGAIIACSALKKSYRDRIRTTAGDDVLFIHLHGSQQLLFERLQNRKKHFMKPQMLQSQLDILEPLTADELGFTVDIDKTEAEIVQQIQTLLAEASALH